MDYAAIIRQCDEMKAKWAEQDRVWREKQAAFDADMAALHMTIRMQNERLGSAVAYLMVNPNPSPEGFAAILGSQSSICTQSPDRPK